MLLLKGGPRYRSRCTEEAKGLQKATSFQCKGDVFLSALPAHRAACTYEQKNPSTSPSLSPWDEEKAEKVAYISHSCCNTEKHNSNLSQPRRWLWKMKLHHPFREMPLVKYQQHRSRQKQLLGLYTTTKDKSLGLNTILLYLLLI